MSGSVQCSLDQLEAMESVERKWEGVGMYVCACLYMCVIGKYNHKFGMDRNASPIHGTERTVQYCKQLCAGESEGLVC